MDTDSLLDRREDKEVAITNLTQRTVEEMDRISVDTEQKVFLRDR